MVTLHLEACFKLESLPEQRDSEGDDEHDLEDQLMRENQTKDT